MIKKITLVIFLLMCIAPFEAKASAYEDDIDLIARLTLGEAEGEEELGQRLVIDTVLNRIDSDSFPDNVHDIVYQSGQFTSAHNGRFKRVTVTDEMRDLVREEWDSRTDADVLFFNTVYIPDTEHLFKVGHHCFSTLKED